MSNDLISVCVPCYNHEKYVEETILSIVSQTYRNLEIIIIDDCSMDQSYDIILSLKEKYKDRFVNFISIRHENNQGTCFSENEFLGLIRGEYIFKIASDDVIKGKDAIELFHKFLSENAHYGLVAGDNEFIDKDSKKCLLDQDHNISYSKNNFNFDSFMRFILSKRPDISIDSKDFGSYQSFLRGNYITNAILLKREVYNKVPFYTKESPLEDWYLMLQISKKWKIKFFNKVTCSYRRHPVNTSANLSAMKVMSDKTRDYERFLLSKPENSEYQSIARKFRIIKERGYFGLFKKVTYENFYIRKKVLYLFYLIPFTLRSSSI